MENKLQNIINLIKADKGSVWMFAVLKMDEFVDKWSIVLSAPWADENDDEIFNYILDILKNNLDKEELSSIARVGVLSKDEHLIEELMNKKSGDTLANSKVNGNFIYEGTIIESNPITV